MKISGFTFVRNGILYGYPFVESIQSMLPLCDELVVAVGRSDDDTLKVVRGLRNPKVRVLETVWDETLRTGGAILAQQTNVALQHATGDWALYLQADEVIHEQDYQNILTAAQQYHADPTVEGLLFNYHHFYGSYQFVGASRKWYRREIRMIRNRIGIQSWGDAQGFRLGRRKVHVKLLEAYIYHYGWVKPPQTQQLKQRTFNRLWHSDEWVKTHVGSDDQYDYSAGGKLMRFSGTHPSVMADRIQHADWKFEYREGFTRQSLKERLLESIERVTGYRVAEYKNYRII